MSNTVDFHLRLFNNQFFGGMKDSVRQAKVFNTAIKKADRSVKTMTTQGKKDFMSLNSVVRQGAGAFAGYFAFSQARQFGQEVKETRTLVAGLNDAITFSGKEEGAANLAYVEEAANRLGLNILGVKKGYKTLTGSMMGSTIVGEKQRKMFEDIGITGSVMKLSSDQINGVFLAMGQIMSKGKVQAEELRGQLGERIPGAFQIAARAMNMSTAELDAYMARGELMAEDFLPKFSAELRKTFEPGLEQAANSFNAAVARGENNYISFTNTIGEKLEPVYMKWFEIQAATYDMILRGIGWVEAHKQGLQDFGVVVGIMSAGWAIYTGVMWAATLPNAIFLVQYGLMTAAQWALNLAMTANPVGVIIMGIAALGAGIYMAYQKSEKFRAILAGIGGVAENIWPIFQGLGDVIAGIFTFDMTQISSGIDKMVDGVNNLDIAGSFNASYDNSIAESRAKDEAQRKKEEEEKKAKTFDITKFQNGNQTPVPTSGGGAKTSSAGVSIGGGRSGGGGPKNITTNIKALVENFHVHMIGGEVDEDQIAEIIEKILVRAVRDSEQALGTS